MKGGDKQGGLLFFLFLRTLGRRRENGGGDFGFGADYQGMVGGDLGQQLGWSEGGRGGVDLEAGRTEEGKALGGDWMVSVGVLGFVLGGDEGVGVLEL